MKLDPFYLIVDSADWIERLVPIGVKLVQLRMKDQPEEVLRAHIRRAKTVCAWHGCQLIINDTGRSPSRSLRFRPSRAGGSAEADVGAIRAAGLKLGLSTHDEAELQTALAAKPDYVALGPIYPTILKQMKWDPQGLERIRVWKDKVGALAARCHWRAEARTAGRRVRARGGQRRRRHRHHAERRSGSPHSGMDRKDGTLAVSARVLIVAGTDSSGGAGIARDVETVTMFGLKTALASRRSRRNRTGG